MTHSAPPLMLPILIATFDAHLEPWELGKFRGAVAHKVGLQHEWFHNHQNTLQKEGFHHRYPLIQYKLHRKCPVLYCLGSCVEEAQHFFSKDDWAVKLGRKRRRMALKSVQLRSLPLKILEDPIEYRLHKWMAFNQDNYQHYQQIRSLAERYTFLERILLSNILSFAKGIRWSVPDIITVAIVEELGPPKYIPYKDIKRPTFNLHFTTNMVLPELVGLGKGVSNGFGVVKQNHYQQSSKRPHSYLLYNSGL